MPQFVSSAIVNAPPPDMLVKVLILVGRAGFTNKRTKNKMVCYFSCAYTIQLHAVISDAANANTLKRRVRPYC